MDVTSTTQVTKTISNDKIATNPNAQLTSNDFMKLFITQLQYQDPTKPMDTEKMLEQTSQMTQLETNNELKKDLEKLITNMNISTQYSAVNIIGKMANTGNDKLVVSDAKNNSFNFKLYFKDDFKNATIKILDKNGDIVRSINAQNGSKGVQSFTWDGKDDNNQPVSDGEYTIEADYTTTNNESEKTKLGIYPVTSVKFDNGKALVKMGGDYIPFSSIKEVL